MRYMVCRYEIVGIIPEMEVHCGKEQRGNGNFPAAFWRWQGGCRTGKGMEWGRKVNVTGKKMGWERE